MQGKQFPIIFLENPHAPLFYNKWSRAKVSHCVPYTGVPSLKSLQSTLRRLFTEIENRNREVICKNIFFDPKWAFIYLKNIFSTRRVKVQFVYCNFSEMEEHGVNLNDTLCNSDDEPVLTFPNAYSRPGRLKVIYIVPRPHNSSTAEGVPPRKPASLDLYEVNGCWSSMLGWRSFFLFIKQVFPIGS